MASSKKGFKGPNWDRASSKVWYRRGVMNVGTGGGDGGDVYNSFRVQKLSSPSLGSKSDANGKVIEAEQSFRAGWSDWKNRSVTNPRSIPTRLTPARIKVGRKTINGMVKKVNGKVKVYVTPATLKRNPSLKKRVKK